MIVYENECVGCPPELGCLGDLCRYRNVPHYVCDRCGDEMFTAYLYGDEHLCSDCALETFDSMDVDELLED